MSSDRFICHPIQHILVGLDLTEMDAIVIKYAAIFCKYIPVKQIYFYHVSSSLDFPDDVGADYKHLLAPVEEGLRKEIEKELNENFTAPANTEVIIKIKEGNAIDKMLRYTKIKSIDLIILGRKQNLNGSGLVSSAIARKSPCHLLLVPEISVKKSIDKVMVPIDFSKHADLAVQYAIEFTGSIKKVICSHIYSVPQGYSKSGKSFEEFAEIMYENAEKAFKQFISEIGNVDCEFILDKDNNPSVCIAKMMDQQNPDLVIIGSKGRTNLATLFLGSMAEKFMMKDADTPLLIVKRKGENMGLLETLMNL